MSKLPKEALQFAKKMGLDLSGLEPEAEEIWRHLDGLASSNESEYLNFISQNAKDPSSDPPESSTMRTFRPEACFSMKGMTTGGDGIKIREARQGKTLYVNFCGHKVVQPPELRGRPMESRVSADGLEIPLLLGEARHLTLANESCVCLDAVINPHVAAQCLLSSVFKAQVIDLVAQWVTQERGITFGRLAKESPRSYMGGLGDAGDTPVLFSVSEHAEDAKPTDPLSDPTSLLLTKRREEEQGSMQTRGVSISLNPTPIGISVTGEKDAKTSSIKEVKSSAEKKDSGIKKGFLSKSSKPLYPTGSSEGSSSGGSGATGGALARIMEKSTVVRASKDGKYDLSAAVPPLSLSVKEREELDGLLGEADEEFHRGGRSSVALASSEMNDDFVKQLACLTLPDSATSLFRDAPATSSTRSVGNVAGEVHVVNGLSSKWTVAVSDSTTQLTVEISGFTSKEELAGVDIQVSAGAMLVTMGSTSEVLRITAALEILQESVEAKSSLKKGKLTVTALYASGPI